MDDQNTPSAPVDDTEAPEQAPAPIEPVSDQTIGSDTPNTPPTAPESPINASDSTPVEDQNPPINQPGSDTPEEPISTPSEPEIPVDDQPVSEPVPATEEPPISEPIQPAPVQSAPVSAPTPPTPTAPQTQPSAQQNQTSFIHSLLIKAQAKIQSNKQKKLGILMQFVTIKGKITNNEAEKVLRISDKTAERYLNKLVTQGKLQRSGAGRDVFYALPR